MTDEEYLARLRLLNAEFEAQVSVARKAWGKAKDELDATFTGIDR